MTSPRVKLGMESGLIGMEGLRAKRERRRNSQEVQRKRGRLNTGNVSALNAIERAAARHRVEDLKAPEIDFTQVLSADIPDKVIQDQLNLKIRKKVKEKIFKLKNHQLPLLKEDQLRVTKDRL